MSGKDYEAYTDPPPYSQVVQEQTQYPPAYTQEQASVRYIQQPSHTHTSTNYCYVPVDQAAMGGVVYQQPTVILVTPRPLSNPPKDHLTFSIIVTVLCCWPIGICAIIKSVNSRDAAKRGDLTNAVRYSNEAKKYASITLGVGIAMTMIWIAIMVIYYIFIFDLVSFDD